MCQLILTISEYVVSNRDGEPLSYTQFKRLWQDIVTRTVKERSYYRYEDGKRVKHTVTPVLGEKAAHNGKVVYSLDFEVTPHQLRHYVEPGKMVSDEGNYRISANSF